MRRCGVWLAVLTVIAFLFRHDHGAFVGLATTVLILSISELRFAERVRHLVIYGLLVLALVAPYFVFIQMNGGVVSYFRQASAWAERDRAREPVVWPGLFDNPDGESDEAKAGSRVANVRDNGAAWVYYTEILLPFFALFVVAASRDGFRSEWPHAREKLAMVAVLGAALDAGFLRSPLEARLADPSVPLVILIAWLMVAVPRMFLTDASLRPSWLPVRWPVEVAARLSRRHRAVFVVLVKGDLYQRLDKASMTDRFGKPFERVGVISNQLRARLGPRAVGGTPRASGPDHLVALHQRVHDAGRSRAGAVVFAAGAGDGQAGLCRRPRRSASWVLRVRGGAAADRGTAPQPIGAHHPARHGRFAAQLLSLVPDRDGVHRPGISTGRDAHLRRTLRSHALREEGPHADRHIRATGVAVFRNWEERGDWRRMLPRSMQPDA